MPAMGPSDGDGDGELLTVGVMDDDGVPDGVIEIVDVTLTVGLGERVIGTQSNSTVVGK